jgi:hypothetical protein
MELKKYKDLSGSAGVTGYKFVANGIILQFKHKELYLYDASIPGKHHIAQMKILAEKGSGLTTYVNQNIRDNYKEKLN